MTAAFIEEVLIERPGATELREMPNKLLHLFAQPLPAALILATWALLGVASQAQAQWFNLGFGLRPEQVEREIVAGGYQLTGPVTRNGNVYLADVVDQRGVRERFVVDASSGRLLQRFRGKPARTVADRIRYPDEPILRPPGLIEGPAPSERLAVPGSNPSSRRAPEERIARSEDPGFSIFNFGSPAQSAAPDVTEKAKLKPAVVKRRKVEPTATAQPTQAPEPVSPANASAPQSAPEDPALAPVSSRIVVAPTPIPAPVAHAAAAPAAAPTPVVVAPPVETQEPRIAETKAAPTETQTAAKSSKQRKPLLNDIPVNPLE
jgi:hypothetical protein